MSGLNGQFLEHTELLQLNFRALGDNVLIHRFVVLVNCQNISLGSNVRIDPFTVLSASGGIFIGSYVHIGSHCSVSGSADVTFEDFSGISSGSRVFSATDDFTGKTLPGPMIPPPYRHIEAAPVHFGRHTALGTGCVVMPGVVVAEGTTVGAFSFVNSSLAEWSFYAGRPARRLHDRQRDVLDLEARLLNSRRSSQSVGSDEELN